MKERKKEKIKLINSTKALEILDFIIGGIPYFYGKKITKKE